MLNRFALIHRDGVNTWQNTFCTETFRESRRHSVISCICTNHSVWCNMPTMSQQKNLKPSKRRSYRWWRSRSWKGDKSWWIEPFLSNVCGESEESSKEWVKGFKSHKVKCKIRLSDSSYLGCCPCMRAIWIGLNLKTSTVWCHWYTDIWQMLLLCPASDK